jgi:hypothetical protein
MKSQRETASFVLRFTHDLWEDQQGEPHIEWRGQCRRVRDGVEVRFTDLTEAVSFIKESLLKVTRECVPKDDEVFQEKAMQESFKLWEKFAQGYTDMIVESIQRSVKQSELFQKQMGEAMEQAMKPWWVPPVAPVASPPASASAADQAQILQTMNALQGQIELLSAKVATLEETIKHQQ